MCKALKKRCVRNPSFIQGNFSTGVYQGIYLSAKITSEIIELKMRLLGQIVLFNNTLNFSCFTKKSSIRDAEILLFFPLKSKTI